MLFLKPLTKEHGGILAYVLLFTFAFSLYLNTSHHAFSYDDKAIILSDHRIRSMKNLAAVFTSDYWMNRDTNLYRPLTMVTLAGNYFVSGLEPWSYRLFNQMLHGANVLLFYLFLGNFFPGTDNRRFLAAAFFAAHPAASEAVDLVVARAEMLSFAFGILSFHLYLKRAEKSWYGFASPVLFFLGLLSKETTMVFPVLLVLYHLYFARIRIATFLRSMGGHATALVLYLLVRVAVLGTFGPQGKKEFFSGLPWTTTALTMIKSLAYYWRIVLWPSGLRTYYDFATIPPSKSIADPGVLFALFFLVAVVGTAVAIRERERAVSYFLIWPFIGFLPVMNIIIPTGILISIRSMYLPLAGYSVSLAALSYWIWSQTSRFESESLRRMTGMLVTALTAGSIIVLSVLTLQRNREWKDEKTLFAAELRRAPGSAFAQRVMLLYLPHEEAIRAAQEFLNQHPDDPIIHMDMGAFFEEQGDHARAEQAFRRALFFENNATAMVSLGIILSNQGRLIEAEALFLKAIELKPQSADPYENLGTLMYKRGDARQALAFAEKALELNPRSSVAWNIRGSCYKDAGDLTKAIAAFEKAVAFSPKSYPALYNRADAYERLGDSRAVESWQSYIHAAEGVAAESPWVAEAKKRLALLVERQGVR